MERWLYHSTGLKANGDSDDFPVSDSVSMIREAKKALETMPREKRIDVMVKAGVLSKKAAERAKKASRKTSE